MQAIIVKNRQRACQLGRQALRLEGMSHNARFLSYHYAKAQSNTTNNNKPFLYTALALGMGAGYFFKDTLA